MLDELMLGGEVQETSKKNVLKAIAAQDIIQEVCACLCILVRAQRAGFVGLFVLRLLALLEVLFLVVFLYFTSWHVVTRRANRGIVFGFSVRLSVRVFFSRNIFLYGRILNGNTVMSKVALRSLLEIHPLHVHFCSRY